MKSIMILGGNMKFIFKPRFNWFDLIYIVGSGFLFAQLGYWSIPIIVAAAVFSGIMEHRYANR